MTKADLRNWLQKEYEDWQALLDEIDPARMETSGVNGDWSMKDIVAHLTGWNRSLVDRLQAALRGEPEPHQPWPAHLESEDEINAWIYESNHGRSARDVLGESRQNLQELLTTIEKLPDTVRIEHIEPNFYLVWVDNERFVASEFFNHFHDDHEPDVRAWLERDKNR